MKILFLDDERNPSDVFWVKYPENAEFTVVRKPSEFLAAASEQAFDLWSMDHDLGDKVVSGYFVLKRALQNTEPFIEPERKGKDRIIIAPKDVIAHSKNPVGAANIADFWQIYKRFAMGDL